jgi:hypothetical protein
MPPITTITQEPTRGRWHDIAMSLPRLQRSLAMADVVLRMSGLEGETRIATKRSPYPTLHLLREESIARVVEAVRCRGGWV